MEVAAIRAKVKEIISNVTNLDPTKIGDTDSYVDDLNLDSLSLLEIGVDVDYAFKLNLPEERMRSLSNVEETVALVLERQRELAQPVAEAVLA